MSFNPASDMEDHLGSYSERNGREQPPEGSECNGLIFADHARRLLPTPHHLTGFGFAEDVID